MEQNQTDILVNGVIVKSGEAGDDIAEPPQATYICPMCGSPKVIIDIFSRNQQPRSPPERLIA